jgi:hypothetical protein
LEALANNVPVLASDIPEHKEILPLQNLISIDSPELWVKSINKILLNANTMLIKLLDSQTPYAKRLCFDWEMEISKRILIKE